MGDHKTARRTVGVRELKAHAARILRTVREEHASYVVTHRGEPVGVLLPVDAAGGAVGEAPAGAWSRFLAAGNRIQAAIKPGASGVKLVSSSRR